MCLATFSLWKVVIDFKRELNIIPFMPFTNKSQNDIYVFSFNLEQNLVERQCFDKKLLLCFCFYLKMRDSEC